MLNVYNLLSSLALFAYLPVLFSKRGPASRKAFVKERLGLSEYEKTHIWVHAVSVGEVIACVPFLKRLRKEFPHRRITLSTITYTGQKVARERFPEADRIMYMPWDCPATIGKAARSLKPDLFITIETELWPSLFSTLRKLGTRIVILNGRISNRSFSGYRRMKKFMTQVLSWPDFFYMQDRSDADRIIALGADRARVGVMGNFKFDIPPTAAEPLPWTEHLDGTILLSASTHAGEEDVVLNAYFMIRGNFPDLRLILAPRHPERFGEVEAMLRKRETRYAKRSELKEGAFKGGTAPDILLLDSMGELSRLFASATIAFVGGSLVPKGGHNILEPAFWSKPVLFGPYMDNFPFAGDFLLEEAAVQVDNARDLARVVSSLLNNPEAASIMGKKARAIVDRNTGAVEKAIALIRGYLGTL